jgi:lysophospholipase L1-like esterase
VLRHVRTYQVLKAWLFDRPAAYYAHDTGLYQNPALVADAAERVAQTGDQARAAGAAFEVVLMPYRDALDDPRWPASVAPLLRALNELGIPVVDARAWLEADRADDWFLYGDGIHLSPAGHARIAHGLAERYGL